MTVAENLDLGAYLSRTPQNSSRRQARVFKCFRECGSGSARSRGSLSGGEQQMLAVGRALMARSKILLLDEPSLGLGTTEKSLTRSEHTRAAQQGRAAYRSSRAESAAGPSSVQPSVSPFGRPTDRRDRSRTIKSMTNSPAITSRDRMRRGSQRAVGGGRRNAGYAFIAGGYFVTIMSFAMIYAVFIIGLNVFMGFAGQVSFGHNAFAALSGYTSAILTATYYWSDRCLCRGAGLALLVALVCRWPTLRLKGHYLAMATLAIGLIVSRSRSMAVGDARLHGHFRIAPLGIAGYEVVSDAENSLH